MRYRPFSPPAPSLAEPARPVPARRAAPGSRHLPLLGPRRLILPLLTLFALLAAAGFPGPASAQESHPVSGTVTGDDGRAAGAAVVQASGPVVRRAVTNSEGAFLFAALPDGEYRLTVEGMGYTGGGIELVVAGPVRDLALTVRSTPVTLEPLRVVTAARAARTAASLPVKVNVVEAEELAQQQTFATNPTELLSNLVPSFSPGRQKLTSAGESFRGRRPLFLIDGVPQSNPLRDGRRDGFTIGMDVVERVEVVFGANAIQGLGATGGIVNYVTVKPPVSGALEQRLSLSTTVDDGFSGDGTGYRANYRIGKDFGVVDAVVSLGWESRGLQFDGADRPIGLDNVQGDIADSDSRNVFLKLGWEPTTTQRLQFTFSDFLLEQNGGYELVAGDRAAGIPATSVEGTPPGTQPVNDVTTASLDWEHRNVLGGTASAQLYLQDFSALYGGGVFGIFQDPELAPVGSLFEQSENNSEKYGLRMTWAGRPVQGLPVDMVGGLDVLRDLTFQRLAQTDRNWVPETTFLNYAPFLQFDVAPIEPLTISAGFRWELATLDVPDFNTLAGNRADFQSVTVTGGEPSFDEPLLNVGAVLSPLDGLRVYGTFSQAFTMPDVGRVLRGISEPNTTVESFLDLQPVETDNVEVGVTHATDVTRFGVTWFRSEAEFGSRLVPNADGIFQVTRQPTRTTGVEVTGRVDPVDFLSVNAAYSYLDGLFDSDGDGAYDSELGAADIGPNRLNLAVDLNPGGPVSGRLQGFHFFDRDFEDNTGSAVAEFDGYTTVDAAVTGRLDRYTVTLSAANLLDEAYITYFGQAATARADRFFAGRGRTLTLRLDARF